MNLQTTELHANSNIMSDNVEDTSSTSLTDTVKQTLKAYFDQLEGSEPNDIYSMVLKQVEAPLLEVVMQQVDGNQTRAAAYLGLNRGTLRKKLRIYGLDNS